MFEFYIVINEGCWCEHTSKVYAIDENRNRFLIYNRHDEFEWIDFEDCKLVKEE